MFIKMLLSISVGSVLVSRVVVSKKGLRLQGVRKTERQSNESKVFFSGNDSLESLDILVFKPHLMVFFRCRCWAVGLLEQKHDSMGHRTAGTQARQGIRHFMLPLVH